MLAGVTDVGFLPQYLAAAMIQRDFGEDFVYRTNKQNLAISVDVLTILRAWSRLQ